MRELGLGRLIPGRRLLLEQMDPRAVITRIIAMRSAFVTFFELLGGQIGIPPEG